MLSLRFNLTPIPKGRPRFAKMSGKSYPRVYTPTDTLEYEKALQLLAKVQLPSKFKLIDIPIVVHIIFKFVKPKTSKRSYPSGKPDLDNLVKCLDAFNGILWEDDALIVEIHAEKIYAGEPGISLTVLPK